MSRMLGYSERLNMFSDRKVTLRMLEGAYRKFKTYYYYDKNNVVIRKKIALFEANRERMQEVFFTLASFLKNPKSKKSIGFTKSLLDSIDFIVLPKSYKSETVIDDSVVTNAPIKDKVLRSVNFFIDPPIEVFILDTLWTLFLGKMANDNKIMSPNTYGNILLDKLLYHDDINDGLFGIDFDSGRLFNLYFYKYCAWRNNAFDALSRTYEHKQNSILISLDIKSYYYSVRFKFDIEGLFSAHPIIKKLYGLTNIFDQIYKAYFSMIKPYRADLKNHKIDETPLPIGLFSSMLFGNLYLESFDKRVALLKNCSYYGRYVDDLLFCFSSSDFCDNTNKAILQSTLVDSGLLDNVGNGYIINGYPNLFVGKEKVKTICIDAKESRAILDLYNEQVRIIPSQMNVLPDSDLQLSDFDESAYTIKNFSHAMKIRDIGAMSVDVYKVARYFSSLVMKHRNINMYEQKTKEVIDIQIEKINEFFKGSHIVEYYSNWMNYAYFLVLARKQKKLQAFIQNVKRAILRINGNHLDREIFLKRSTLGKKARESLYDHLDISISTAYALDITKISKLKIGSVFMHYYDLSQKILNANMFNHSLVALPLANYLEYLKEVSFSRLTVSTIGSFSKEFELTFKVKWSPRFIHFQELLFLQFMHNHNLGKPMRTQTFLNGKIVDAYYRINHIVNVPHFSLSFNSSKSTSYYELQKIRVPESTRKLHDGVVTIAVGSLRITVDDCIRTIENHWNGLTIKNKTILFTILRKAYEESEHHADILVLPELYIPIYWLNEVINFAKKTQIAIITGLQYIPDKDSRVCNYIAAILPFESNTKKYKNVFMYIREKNDYSHIEKMELAKYKKTCVDAVKPKYQIYQWRGLDIATFLCYELTDIVARALMKGECDIIAAPVFNSDTTYFSNIIDSATRDLHAVIIQANTSIYGDSRITGPYDRDSKDMIRIKGGENDNLIIGTVQIGEINSFQSRYYEDLDNTLKSIAAKKKGKKEEQKPKIKPEIKRLSARFDTTRSKTKYIAIKDT